MGQYEIIECNIMSQDAINNITFRNIKPIHKIGTNIWEQMLQIKKNYNGLNVPPKVVEPQTLGNDEDEFCFRLEQLATS